MWVGEAGTSDEWSFCEVRDPEDVFREYGLKTVWEVSEMKAESQSNEVLRKRTEAIFGELDSGPQGIRHEEAQKRLSEYGPNAIEQK